MILYIIVYWFFLFEAQKSHFIQKISIWKYGFLNFWGILGGHPVNLFFQNDFKPSTITGIKKSLTFWPQKIIIKLIYSCFPFGGADKAPPPQIGLKFYRNIFKDCYLKTSLKWKMILHMLLDLYVTIGTFLLISISCLKTNLSLCYLQFTLARAVLMFYLLTQIVILCDIYGIWKNVKVFLFKKRFFLQSLLMNSVKTMKDSLH